MSLDSYVNLGRCGLVVSPFCLGAMNFGEDTGTGCSVSESETIMQVYVDRGGNFIDTANSYTNTHSERSSGTPLPPGRGCATASSSPPSFSSTSIQATPTAPAPDAKRSCDNCRTRCAGWAPTTSTSSTGCITTIRTRQLMSCCGPSTILSPPGPSATSGSQTPPRGSRRRPRRSRRFEAGLRSSRCRWSTRCSHARSRAKSFRSRRTQAWRCYPGARSGAALTGKYTRDQPAPADAKRAAAFGIQPTAAQFDVIETVTELARHIGVPPAAVALAWVHGRPGVTSTLIGPRRVDQLETNLGALDLQLSADQRATLDRISMPQRNFPAALNRDLGRCSSTPEPPSTVNKPASTRHCFRARSAIEPLLPARTGSDRTAFVRRRASQPARAALCLSADLRAQSDLMSERRCEGWLRRVLRALRDWLRRLQEARADTDAGLVGPRAGWSRAATYA